MIILSIILIIFYVKQLDTCKGIRVLSLSGITCFQTWKQHNVKEQHLAKLHYYELYQTPINMSRTMSSTFSDLSLGALPWLELYRVFCKVLAQRCFRVHVQKTVRELKAAPQTCSVLQYGCLERRFWGQIFHEYRSDVVSFDTQGGRIKESLTHMVWVGRGLKYPLVPPPCVRGRDISLYLNLHPTCP